MSHSVRILVAFKTLEFLPNLETLPKNPTISFSVEKLKKGIKLILRKYAAVN